VGYRGLIRLLVMAGSLALVGYAANNLLQGQVDARWKLVWSDEFNGTAVDRAKWDFNEGNGFTVPDTKAWVPGWGNDELQYYTNRPENAYVKDGMLHIRAVREPYKSCQYTSARLVTKGLFGKTYGRFEFRAKLPTGTGLWPALWLLPVDEVYGGWAASGEIDVMEARGQEPSKVLGTIHFGSRWPNNDHSGAEYVFPDKGGINDFHVYALEWEPGVMRWYVDSNLYSTKRRWWSSSKINAKHEGVRPTDLAEQNPWPKPFDKPFYIVMNLAIGGRFPGNPDTSTTFPTEMVVDYVRVYDKAGGYGSPLPPGNEGNAASATAP
jgi:beta-glucanase (GH16 family)